MKTKITRLVTQFGKLIKARKYTLVTAESCTGGGLAHYITMNPQASSILERGYVTYSTHAKESLLNVTPYAMQTHGAVSKEVALEMAEGALKNSAAQIAIAITGIAGPDARISKTSKGVVWICCTSCVANPILIKKDFSGSRQRFSDAVIHESLIQLIKYIGNI